MLNLNDNATAFTTITKREYFMAHAPSEPAPWFQPNMPPKPKEMVPMQSNEGQQPTEDERFEQHALLNSPREFVRKKATYRKFSYWFDGLWKYQDEKDAWDILNCRETYLQWPSAWADLQLEIAAAPRVTRSTLFKGIENALVMLKSEEDPRNRIAKSILVLDALVEAQKGGRHV